MKTRITVVASVLDACLAISLFHKKGHSYFRMSRFIQCTHWPPGYKLIQVNPDNQYRPEGAHKGSTSKAQKYH